MSAPMPTTLSRKIIERFLQGKELEDFFAQYNAKRNSIGGSRANMLQQPITEEDLYILTQYTTNTDKTLKEVAESISSNISAVFGRAGRIALRVIAQHPEILKQVVVRENEK